MTLLEFTLVFLLGLAGSLHCLQMCGPIVLSYSVSLAGQGVQRKQMLSAHLSYNAGRILTYVGLGVLAGAAGSGIGMLGKLAGLASGARIFAGAAYGHHRDSHAARAAAEVAGATGTAQRDRVLYSVHRAVAQIVARFRKVPTGSGPGLPALRPHLRCALEIGGDRQSTGRRPHHAGLSDWARHWRYSVWGWPARLPDGAWALGAPVWRQFR